MINRRSYLAGISATSAFLSGCSELTSSNGNSNSRFSQLILVNGQKEPVTIELTITQDDEVVHDKNHQIEAASGNTAKEKIISEDWMNTPAKYQVNAKLDSITSQYNSEEQIEIHSKAETNPCFRIAIMTTESLQLGQIWQVDEDCDGEKG